MREEVAPLPPLRTENRGIEDGASGSFIDGSCLRPGPLPMNVIKKLLTESDNETWCPIRVGGSFVLAVLIWYAASGIIHKTGDNFMDVCKGFAWYIGAWAAAIGGKSKLGGDANASSGPPTP